MPSRAEELFGRITSAEKGSAGLFTLRSGASLGSWLYGIGAGWANLGFDLGLRRPKRLPVPVIGVGNLSVGGSGKTPLVAELVETLEAMGLPAGVLSRGYGGSVGRGVRLVSQGRGPVLGAEQAGDEPVMLARRLNSPVAVGGERFTAAKVLLSACGPRVLVADDLYQHRRLHRDLNIAVLPLEPDPRRERLLPRGRLREPLCGLRRAHAVVLSHADNAGRVTELRRWLRSYWGAGPVLACRHRLAGLFSAASGKPVIGVKDRPVFAFCGLGRPEAFERGLQGLGLDLRGLQSFGDHHRYTGPELEDLAQKAMRAGAEVLLTSEKDLARLGQARLALPLWVTRLSLEFEGGRASLAKLLAWGLRGWGVGA